MLMDEIHTIKELFLLKKLFILLKSGLEEN
jgi:hypothetical protein